MSGVKGILYEKSLISPLFWMKRKMIYSKIILLKYERKGANEWIK